MIFPSSFQSQHLDLELEDQMQLDPDNAAAYMDQKKIYSLLAAPLIKDGHAVGLISLANRDSAPFTEDDRRQLNRIAALASIAINRWVKLRTPPAE